MKEPKGTAVYKAFLVWQSCLIFIISPIKIACLINKGAKSWFTK